MHTTTATPTITTKAEFLTQLDAAVDDIAGQCLVSQGRSVDQLLDLYNLATDSVVRAAITFAIDDIRRLTAVRVDDLVDSLRLIAAVAEVEGAFSAEVQDAVSAEG